MSYESYEKWLIEQELECKPPTDEKLWHDYFKSIIASGFHESMDVCAEMADKALEEYKQKWGK